MRLAVCVLLFVLLVIGGHYYIERYNEISMAAQPIVISVTTTTTTGNQNENEKEIDVDNNRVVLINRINEQFKERIAEKDSLRSKSGTKKKNTKRLPLASNKKSSVAVKASRVPSPVVVVEKASRVSWTPLVHRLRNESNIRCCKYKGT